MTNEIVFVKNELIVEDGHGRQTFHKANIGKNTIDSLHSYRLTWQPANDSINNIINCNLQIIGVPTRGAVEACDFKYKIQVLTEHWDFDFSKVMLSWKPVTDTTQPGILDDLAYFVVVADESDLNLRLFTTTENRLQMDLSDFQSHRWLTLNVRTVDPCGTSDSFPINSLVKDN
ncbi:MAG: hypothetical protein ACMVP2_17345 [Imperialibacter sp.]|uniref:hypothetical protein n=1 Tax=Imperialibacter sp. TaxID=2038411 RepID=UPI003A8548DE